MGKRYAVMVPDYGYWGEGSSIMAAVGNLPMKLQGDWLVDIVAVPADGVERLSVDGMGQVLVHGPNQDAAAAAMEEVYVGAWEQHTCQGG